MGEITTMGLDLAKQIIQAHAMDAVGRVAFRKAVRRERVSTLLAQSPLGMAGIEACSGAHHWAPELAKLGHESRVMAALFVQPFRKRIAAKNDADASFSSPPV